VSGSTAQSHAAAAPAKLRRRFLSLLYEFILLTALIMTAALPVVMLTAGWRPIVARTVLQVFLVAVCGFYFVWQWTRAGQTLAMKTWRLKLVTSCGGPPAPARACARYLLALAGTLLCGFGFFWALADREQKFLHDRLAGTTVVNTEN
jgi:uncharacterized RDD family membrane protein YckC